MFKSLKNLVGKGNAFDWAVCIIPTGIVLGCAFGLLIKSLLDNLIIPVIGALFSASRFQQHVC